jgi:hypothetical protein
VIPAYCQSGGTRLWGHLATCGWPGAANTGPMLIDCPRRRLVKRGNGITPIVLARHYDSVRCDDLRGPVEIKATGVTITNSRVTLANGARVRGNAAILIEAGATATISHVTVVGRNKVHACHGFAKATASSRDDGFQTEGSAHGLISHNTFRMPANSTSAIALWDSLRSSSDITVKKNLIAGGGLAVLRRGLQPR